MVEELHILASKARLRRWRRFEWLNLRISKFVAGPLLAVFLVMLCTLFSHSSVYAKELHAYRSNGQLATSTVAFGAQKQTRQVSKAGCDPTVSIEKCLLDPTGSGFSNNYQVPQNPKIQNPLPAGKSLFYVTPASSTIDYDAVKALWGIILGVVDGFVVLILMLNGLRMIVGGTVFRYANVVETLPGVLLALVAAHLSMLIVALFLGFNNVVSVDLYQWAESNNQIVVQPKFQVNCRDQNNNPLPANDPNCQLPEQMILNAVQITPASFDLPNMGDVLQSLNNITDLVIKVLGLMLFAQMIIRLFFIDLYIILSPLGIACWALPGKAGQPLTRLWLHGLISIVMVQAMQVLALIITQVSLFPIAYALMGSGGNYDTMGKVLAIAVLWFVLRIPSLFGTAPMRTMAEAGQAMGQVAGASVAVSVAELQGVMSVGTSVAGMAIAR